MSTTTPDAGPAPSRDDGAATRRRWWPRVEMVFIAVSLLGTIAAKCLVIVPQEPDHLVGEIVRAGMSDVIFFASVVIVFAGLRFAVPGAWAARTSLLIAAILAGWSILNGAWLKATGVQLQLSVVELAAVDADASGDVIVDYLRRNLIRVIPIVLIVAACAAWFVWRLVRPASIAGSRRGHLRVAAIAAGVVVVAIVLRGLGPSQPSVWGQAIGFSSHWFALSGFVGDATRGNDEMMSGRVLPRAGERTIIPPPPLPPEGRRPNVVLILLESVSFSSCSLGDRQPDTTPTLRRLATEGTEFRNTHVPIPLTTKAFWASLTGTAPAPGLDTVEAVLVDEPYESLATILRRDGYRSGFFQMARRALDGSPGIFANLGFDWAWFRENLEDESSHVTYVAGDDFRMLDPMFEWVDGDDDPFLLAMITSVGHEPYWLPDWYGAEPTDDMETAYLRTVEYTDDFVQAVIERLQARGLDDDTVVCVMGDHGDSFREDARRTRWTPYEETIRVPWVIRAPGRVEPGRRIDGPCSQIDVTPTLLGILGYGIDDAGFEGRDALRPIDRDRRIFFASFYRKSPVGYLSGTDKYVYWPYTDTVFRFDLAADPGETAPHVLDGDEKQRVIDDTTAWQRANDLAFPARRFRERLIFDHWRTHSTGRVTATYYVP